MAAFESCSSIIRKILSAHRYLRVRTRIATVLLRSASSPSRTRRSASRLARSLPALRRVAGGPKYVAGASFFNPAVLGQPVHWANGQVNYYVDQGPLNSFRHQPAGHGHGRCGGGPLERRSHRRRHAHRQGRAERRRQRRQHSSAVNFRPARSPQPADVTPSATNYPLGVIFDADGSVINAIFGAGASQPNSCQNNGVYVWMDNVNPDATIAHGSSCSTASAPPTPTCSQMMSFELERAFGRILGLDYSQVNPGALTNGETGGTHGWPVMQPLSGVCGASGGACIPNPTVLRWDDIAALNRIYPITAANLASFPGKQITAANTVSIQGTISFRTGYGMQGVNVVARPLDANGNPALPVHGHCRLRRLLQRQSRQPRHRIRRRERQPAHHVGIERRHRCKASST